LDFKSGEVFSIFLNNFAWPVFHSWVLKGFDHSRHERHFDTVAFRFPGSSRRSTIHGKSVAVRGERIDKRF